MLVCSVAFVVQVEMCDQHNPERKGLDSSGTVRKYASDPPENSSIIPQIWLSDSPGSLCYVCCCVQQAEVLSSAGLATGILCSTVNMSRWKTKEWAAQVLQYDVLLMTPVTLLQGLTRAHISVSDMHYVRV